MEQPLMTQEPIRLSFSLYRMPANGNFSVGRDAGHDIQCDAGDLISRSHAAFQTEDRGILSVHDLTSRTGVRVNGLPVSDASLKMGDVVEIGDMQLICLPNLVGIRQGKGTFSCRLERAQKEKDTDRDDLASEYDRTMDDATFVRSPRILKTLDSGTVDIDTPPGKQHGKKLPILFTMGPSLTMGIAMVASLGITIGHAGTGGNPATITTSATMAVSMLVGSILWPVLMTRYQKREDDKMEQERREKYLAYVRRQEALLEKKRERNGLILTEILQPSPQRVLELLQNEKDRRRLWERNPQDADFLCIRLGLGRLPFDVRVMVQKERFTMDTDDLAQEPYRLQAKYETVDLVPVTLSMVEERTIGMVGEQEDIRKLLPVMVMQLAAMHSPEEVKMVLVSSSQDMLRYDWMKNLPHLWSTDREVRFLATNREEVHELFSYLDSILKERETTRGESRDHSVTQYIFFLLEADLVENEPLMRYVQHPGNPVGATGIFAYGQLERLPKDCRAILQTGSEGNGLYVRDKRENRILPFVPDVISETDCVQFGQLLCDIRMKSADLNINIPESVSFLGLYKAGRIEELDIAGRWGESLPHKSLAAPIGIRSGGEIFALDIHESYHGPHGLVAGMTGSGKSEFLQAYILSMAVNYHPHDVSFVLIDYKGGGMANTLVGLPHLAGTITNLSGSQLRRSLVAIRAEMRRRQHLFAQAGVNHIDKYQKLWKESRVETPLPHLVVISDEFAQLKSQQPEFMQELVDVAQIGRSLGLHMILATQKPAGVVDDQIWGNSRFRVCLKVLDRQDSSEMIRRPDASAIKLPGRCYVQVGYDEIFEHVQSGYSGMDYIPEDSYVDASDRQVVLIDACATPLRTARLSSQLPRSGKSQLEALIEAIRQVAADGSVQAMPLWMPPLPEILTLDNVWSAATGNTKTGFDGKGWSKTPYWMRPLIGLSDLPDEQRQTPLWADLGKRGHIALYGATGTGKTTFVQTLLFSLASQYAPDEVWFDIFDFGGRTLGYFTEAPHCRRVVFADDEAGVSEVLDDLAAEVERRRYLFSECNVGGMEAFMQATGKVLPAIILVIDQYVVMHERFSNQEDTIVTLARDGRNYGVFLVLTGSTKTSIYYRVTDYFKHMYTLQMNDRYHYREILGPTGDLEPEAVPGRGLAMDGRVMEFQTALAVAEANEAMRVNRIREALQQMRCAWDGMLQGKTSDTEISQRRKSGTNGTADMQRSMRITPASGKNIETQSRETMSGLPSFPASIPECDSALSFGVDMRSGEVVRLNAQPGSRFFIGAHALEETEPAMQHVARQLTVRQNVRIALFDPGQRLSAMAQDLVDWGYVVEPEAMLSFMSQLEQEMQAMKERQDKAPGDHADRTDAMPAEYDCTWCLLLHDFDLVFRVIPDEALDRLERLLASEMGRWVILVTTGSLPRLHETYSGQPFYKTAVETQAGLLMHGPVKGQSVIPCSGLMARHREIRLPDGAGFVWSGDTCGAVRIPTG